MKKHLAFIVLMTIAFFGYSQQTTTVTTMEVEEFSSEVTTTDRGAYTRPGQNIKKGLQVELGLDYEWTEWNNDVYKTDNFTPLEAKLRLGLSKYVEVDFAISNKQLILRPWDENGSFSKDKYNYWTPLEIGLRTQFVDSKKKCDLDASLYIGMGVNNTQRSSVDDNGNARPWVLVDRPNYVTPEFGLFVDHNIGERIELGYNFGVNWTGIPVHGAKSAKNPDVYYTIRALVHATTTLDVYVEHFNAMRKAGAPTIGINAGARYAISSKFVVDLNLGAGFNNSSPDGFAGLGLAYKLGK